MSPVFAARRRAEEFQAMVEGASTERGSDARLGEFLELVESLRETAPVTARPGFVAELREQLLDEARIAARTGRGAEMAARLTVARAPSERRRERRLATAIGGIAIVGATTGMAVAAQSALPGDPLYPLKRAIENAQTGVQVDEDAKGKSLLENASGRLEEVDQLSRESDDAQTISETLHSFTNQAREASELLLSDYAETGEKDSVVQLRDFTAESMKTLTTLEPLVPEEARASLIRAAQTLAQIDQEALIACPSCGPGVVTQIPTFTHVAALKDLLDTVTATVQPQGQPPTSSKDAKPDKETGQVPPHPDELPLLDDSSPAPSEEQSSGDKGDGLVEDTIDAVTGRTEDGVGADDGKTGLLDGLTDGITGVTGGLTK